MQIKISIIVPVYKVEEYLPRCLRSIAEQTVFDDLEVFLVDDGSPDRCGALCDEFAAAVTETLNIPAVAPYNGASYDLLTGICLEKGNRKRIEQKPRNKRDEAVFARLLTAGKRLLSIIEKYRQAANKDIAAFADQITALCNKWDK